MEVTIVEREPMTIVGWAEKFIHIRSPEATSMSVIGNLWRNVFKYDVLKGMPGCLGHPTWGVIWGDPVPQRARIDELNYLAGVPFAGVPALPEGMAYRHVPGGMYAKITHKGPLSGLAKTIEHLYGTWLPGSGYDHAGQGDLELYDERFFKEGPEQEFDYFISVKPAAAAIETPPQVTITASPPTADTEETGKRSRQFNEKKRTDALREKSRNAPAKGTRVASASARSASKRKKPGKAKKPAAKKARKPAKKRAAKPRKPAKKKPAPKRKRR